MSNKLTKEDIEEINNCFIEFQRQDDFLPITLEKIMNNSELLEQCLFCVDDMYHKNGIKDDWEPNQYGLKLYHIEEKLNHRRYQLEDMDNFNT